MRKLVALLVGGLLVTFLLLSCSNHKTETQQITQTPVPTLSTSLPPSVVAPASTQTTSDPHVPSGKYANLEARFDVIIHGYLDMFSTARAYTRCRNDGSLPEIFVSPLIDPREEFGVIAHEYGHVLECEQGWGTELVTVRGEHVADAVSIRLGGYSTYGIVPTGEEFKLADGLLSERTG